jgi:hypothetical protein
VTNLRWKSSNVVRFYSKQGTAEQLSKIGAKVVRHSRYIIFQMAELAVRKALF